MVSFCSAVPGGDQEKPSTDRSRTRRSPTSKLLVPPRPPRPPHPLQPLDSLKTSPAAALQNAAKVNVDPIVHEWLDAEGLDVRPSCNWVKRLLHGMRLSYEKPAKCVKELHSLEQHHANTHRLFIKLC